MAVEKQKLLHILSVCVCVCVCVAFYPARNAHAPCYSRLWHVCLPLTHFSTLFRKRHDFRGYVIEDKMCVLIFYTNFVWKISHYKKNSARYHHKCTQVRLQVKYRYCQIFHETSIFSTDFRKILFYQTSWKSVQWETSCSMWRTDIIKLIAPFTILPTHLKTSQLMLYTEIIAVFSQIHTKHITWIIYKDPVRTAQ